MDIPIHAQVFCTDGKCGQVSCVLINPVTKKVTHLIVKMAGFFGLQRMVPVEFISESFPEKILLNCTLEEASQMEDFIDIIYIRGEDDIGDYQSEHYYFHPYVMPDIDNEYTEISAPFLEVENIPAGELAVRPGIEVITKDDFQVGKVDEFLVVDEKITHLILREGHLWGKKQISIPVSSIDRIGNDGVHLIMTKDAVGELPTIPVRPFWVKN